MVTRLSQETPTQEKLVDIPMFFLDHLNQKSVFSVKWTDKSAKDSVKHQLIHEAREAIDKTSFHALPLVTADVASWFKVQHF